MPGWNIGTAKRSKARVAQGRKQKLWAKDSHSNMERERSARDGAEHLQFLIFAGEKN